MFITIAALLSCLWLFFRMSGVAARSGESAPVYSSYRYDPFGVAALRELLARRNISVQTLEHPRLEQDAAGVLVQVLAADVDNRSQKEGLRLKDVIAWIADGNTVVQLTRVNTELMDELGFENAEAGKESGFGSLEWTAANALVKQEAKDIEKKQSQGGLPDDLPGSLESAAWLRTIAGNAIPGENGRRLQLRSPMLLVHRDKRNWIPLATTPAGVVAGVLKYGTGRLVVVGAPSPVLNFGLPQESNLEFVLDLVGGGPVYIDEWSHGIGRVDSILTLLSKAGLFPLLLQLCFLVALYTWSARRVFRLRSRSTPIMPKNTEQAETLGYLYARIMPSDEVEARVRAEAFRRIAGALRCPVEAVESRKIVLPKPVAEKLSPIMEKIDSLRCPMKKIRKDSTLPDILSLTNSFVEYMAGTTGKQRSIIKR
jgi:hypothetical protein